MAAIKNLVISICDLYLEGYTVKKISEIYNLPLQIVEQVLSDYCEEYSEIA
jgi:hypothetical protein